MPDARTQSESLVVVNVDRVSRGTAEIESILAPLGIPVEVVESGRQLRWHQAVVLRIPDDRMADAMLALAMRGYPDVVAYQANSEAR